MNNRRVLAFIFIAISLVLGAIFYSKIENPNKLGGYLESEYLNQLGPLTISIELLIAGIALFVPFKKVNFTLAVFAFTALLDPLFNLAGIFSSQVPLYATILLAICAILALWIAFTDTFNTGKISFWGSLGSFLLGVIVELLFNFWL